MVLSILLIRFTTLLADCQDLSKKNVQIATKEDDNFSEFLRSLDGRLKDTVRGIGTVRKSADPEVNEVSLWDKGVLSVTNGEGLLRAVYFYNSKVYALRACDDHRNMQSRQFSFSENSHGKYVAYHGRGNKVFSGGIRDRKVEDKYIRQYDSDNPRSVI